MVELQDYLKKQLAISRAESMLHSSQLILGELILKLDPLVEKYKNKGKDDQSEVVFDFEYIYPTVFDSWRGSYKELALGFALDGYSRQDNQLGKQLLNDFYKMCKDTIGLEFTGWKGGKFVMNKHTPIWAANSGNSGNTGIKEVIDNTYEIILMTCYCKL